MRLNRVVNEVLDFARPIRFELAPADLNALCRESAAASGAATAGGPAVHLDLDATLPRGHDRRRAAAHRARQHARERPARRERRGSGPPSRSSPLSTRCRADRATIVVADRGAGIDPADLPRVFDPYFTTKRGGTGLGLAIAKNIIEGLGGTIGVTSTPGRGTEIRIELPVHA